MIRHVNKTKNASQLTIVIVLVCTSRFDTYINKEVIHKPSNTKKKYYYLFNDKVRVQHVSAYVNSSSNITVSSILTDLSTSKLLRKLNHILYTENKILYNFVLTPDVFKECVMLVY